MAIIEQIFVDFAKKIEGSVWPANFLGVMQKSQSKLKIISLNTDVFLEDFLPQQLWHLNNQKL